MIGTCAVVLPCSVCRVPHVRADGIWPVRGEDRALAGSPRSSPGRPDGILSAPCALACDIVTVEVARRPVGLPVGVRIGRLAVFRHS